MSLAGKHWLAGVIWVALFAGIYLFIDARMTPKVIVAADGKELLIPRAGDAHFYVGGEINGQPVTFMVDTGASTVSVSRVLARRLGLPSGRPTQVNTANGIASAEEVAGQTVRLGGMVVRDVRVVVLDGLREEALLGQNVLRHLEVVQTAEQMKLRARSGG